MKVESCKLKKKNLKWGSCKWQGGHAKEFFRAAETCTSFFRECPSVSQSETCPKPSFLLCAKESERNHSTSFRWNNFIRNVHPVLLKFVGDLSLPLFCIGPTVFLVCTCLPWSWVCNVVDAMGATDASITDSVSNILKI